jgi:sigma-B regulation protein RsbU (phosphoserine phosphatase)
MTMARGFLRMRAAQPGSLADIVGDLNFHLTKDTLGTGRFMTLMLVEIQQDCQEIHWVRAGHDPALLYDPSRDRFRELLGRGVALGVVPEAGYQVRKVKGLAPGQVLVVGTDGIWEAQDREGEMFGKQRLKNIIKAKAGLSSLGILDEVFKALWDFSGRRLRDDATLVVIKAGAAPPM